MNEEFQHLQEYAHRVLAMRQILIEHARRVLVGKRVRCYATITEVEGVVETIGDDGVVTIAYSYLASGRSYTLTLLIEEIGYRLTLVDEGNEHVG